MSTRRVLAVTAAALALSASLSGPAWADPPVEATGYFQQLAAPTVVSEERRGRTTHSYVTDVSVGQGDLLSTPPGVANATEYWCVAVEGKNTIRCRGEGTATLTVSGVGTGAAVTRLTFECTVVPFLCKGRIQIRGTSGPLAGVHAHGTFEGTGRPGQSAYSLKLHRH